MTGRMRDATWPGDRINVRAYDWDKSFQPRSTMIARSNLNVVLVDLSPHGVCSDGDTKGIEDQEWPQFRFLANAAVKGLNDHGAG